MEMYGKEWAARFEDWANASIAGRDGLFRLANTALADLPENARVLIVGCGTGSEILALASRHVSWEFEAVDLSGEMLDVCRHRLSAAGVARRVTLHHRSIEGLRVTPCDAATAILVSQHIVADSGASRFFSEIALNLVNGAPLFSVDISLPDEAVKREAMLQTWKHQAIAAGLPTEAPENLISRFGRDLLARSPAQIEELLLGAGFRSPLLVFHSTIYHAWISQLMLS